MNTEILLSFGGKKKKIKTRQWVGKINKYYFKAEGKALRRQIQRAKLIF